MVPKTVVCGGALEGKLNAIWNRRQATMFNGASNISQEGGLAALSGKGMRENRKIIAYYMKNAKVIREGLESIGLSVYGGVNAPYLWVKVPREMKSWEFFDKVLSEAHVVCTSGSGFGAAGEGFARFTAFGNSKKVKKAVESIKKNLVL